MSNEKQPEDTDGARDLLSDQVFAARTLPEIAAAQEALRQWMRNHPNEQGMRDGFELLSHREDFAKDREAQRQPATEESAEMSVVARERRKPPKYSGMRG